MTIGWVFNIFDGIYIDKIPIKIDSIRYWDFDGGIYLSKPIPCHEAWLTYLDKYFKMHYMEIYRMPILVK